MNVSQLTVVSVVGLLLGSMAMLEIGWRIGLSRVARHPEEKPAGLAVVEGAVYSLLALLMAFTFYGAAARFDTRRQLITEEANAIGTAYLRLDLLPADAQPGLKDKFRRYVELRLEAYQKLPDVAAAYRVLADSQALSATIWRDAVTGSRDSPPPAAMLLLPAINQMIDIATTRTMATRMHPPLVIFGMLLVLVLVSSLLVGSDMAAGKTRSWLHLVVYPLVLAATVFLILDLEYPRHGLIRVDPADQLLMQVRQGMK